LFLIAAVRFLSLVPTHLHQGRDRWEHDFARQTLPMAPKARTPQKYLGQEQRFNKGMPHADKQR